MALEFVPIHNQDLELVREAIREVRRQGGGGNGMGVYPNPTAVITRPQRTELSPCLLSR